MSHTPGPWYVEEQDYKSSSYYIRGSDYQGRRLSWAKGAVAHIPRSTVMPMRANARLIAAAPELLEALKGVVRVADRATVEFDAARAAIAKAEAA